MSEFAGPNPFADSPKTNTPIGAKSIFGADLLNLSFSPFSHCAQTDDFGRESLGIFDATHFDRESLFCLSDEFGRESLGIVNLSGLDLGRESLGITNIQTYDFLLSNVNLPQIPEEPNVIADDDVEEFNDAVFIEGNHLAGRIADGSFVRAGNDTLDSEEPDGLVDISNEEAAVKCDTEEVFKSVDKLLGRPDHDQNVPNEENPSNQLNESEKNHTAPDGNIDKSPNLTSNDPIDIINSLSRILSNDVSSDKQKSRGKSLLSSLAEIVLSGNITKSRSSLPDASPPSTIEDDSVATSAADQFCEPLDLRKRSNSDTNLNQRREVVTPLDLSMKSVSVCASPKILHAKFNTKQRTSLMHSNNSAGSGCSISSNDSKNSSDLKKFRLKRTDEAFAKRGPMKAVIPINIMAKESGGKLKMSPKRSESRSLSKLKKNTTPISDSNMKPMAQSTPDNPKSSCPSSPLARPNSALHPSPKMLQQRFSSSGRQLPVAKGFDNKNTRNSCSKEARSGGDLKKTQNGQKSLVRRYSMDETRNSCLREASSGGGSKTTQNGQKPLVRRSSLEQKSGIASLAKQTSHRASLPKFKTGAGLSVLKENRNRMMERPSGIKKSGKENLQ